MRLALPARSSPNNLPLVIASIAFRNFKALRNTSVNLSPFNLVIGPNGSGKTSLIEAILRLRTLSRLPLVDEIAVRPQKTDGPEIEFLFDEASAGIVARMGCVSETVCDTLRLVPPNPPGWPRLRDELGTIRGYVLDHQVMSDPSRRSEGAELEADGRIFANGLRMRSRP